MAGVGTDEVHAGGRRAVDAAINMIPMVDLLVCCISFLLVTAVWSQMARVETTALAPGRADEKIERMPGTVHVDMRSAERFTISHRVGGATLSSREVARASVSRGGGLTYPALAAELAAEARGEAAGGRIAVVHAGDRTPTAELVGVFDAIASVSRDGKPALRASLAED